MTASKPVPQWTATQYRDELRLIPPLAGRFTLCGGPGTVERARTWALGWRYLLADGVPACAHGLYLMASCPKGTCATRFRQLDHARIWVPAAEAERPFLLSHPYTAEISTQTRQYADAHGLDLGPGNPGDDWYGHGTTPIMMTIRDNWPLWPIEEKTTTLLATQPVVWPDDDQDKS